MLWWRFRKYLWHFQVFTVKAFSETAVFRECSNQDFEGLQLGKYISYGDHLFFFKIFKIWCINGTKIENKVFVFQIIAFELGVAYSRNISLDTCNRQAMYEQTHQRFHLALGEKFSESTSLRMLKKDEKCAPMKKSQVFGTLSHVDCQSVFWNGGF